MKTVSNKAVLLMALFATSLGFAQSDAPDSRSEFKVGFKGGVSLSNIYDQENQDYVADNKTGYFLGGFLSIPLGKYIGLQPEVLYSQKGFKGSGSVGGLGISNYDFSRTSNFIDIPLQLQLKPIEYVTILAGPQFSYLVDTKNTFNGSSNTITEDEINKDNYKKNIFGFVVGADINIEHFVISGRAGWDVSKSDKNGDDTTPRYKNRVVQLGVGYTF